MTYRKKKITGHKKSGDLQHFNNSHIGLLCIEIYDISGAELVNNIEDNKSKY